MRITAMVAAGAAVVLAAMLVIGFREATDDPVVRTARIALPDWPAGAPPITVALLSDIHIGNVAMDEARLGRIVAQVTARHPDIVLIAGDFVVGHDPGSGISLAPRLTGPLSGLHPRLGVFAVLGNHDHWTGAPAVERALAAAGIPVLSNRAVTRGPVTIVGIDDAFSGHDAADTAFADAGGRRGARIVVTHSPDILASLHGGQAPLVLAGHTHCGQVVMPGGGALTEHSPFSGRRLYDPRY